MRKMTPDMIEQRSRFKRFVAQRVGACKLCGAPHVPGDLIQGYRINDAWGEWVILCNKCFLATYGAPLPSGRGRGWHQDRHQDRVERRAKAAKTASDRLSDELPHIDGADIARIVPLKNNSEVGLLANIGCRFVVLDNHGKAWVSARVVARALGFKGATGRQIKNLDPNQAVYCVNKLTVAGKTYNNRKGVFLIGVDGIAQWEKIAPTPEHARALCSVLSKFESFYKANGGECQEMEVLDRDRHSPPLADSSLQSHLLFEKLIAVYEKRLGNIELALQRIMEHIAKQKPQPPVSTYHAGLAELFSKLGVNVSEGANGNGGGARTSN